MISFTGSDDREGIKERENGERGEGGRGGVGRLFEGGDYFKYFHQSQGGRLIEGRLLFEEIRSGATTD